MASVHQLTFDWAKTDRNNLVPVKCADLAMLTSCRLPQTFPLDRTSTHNIYPPRAVSFESKVGQIGHKWEKSGTFSDQISVHFS